MLVNWLLVVGGAVCVLLEVVMGGFAGFDLVLIGSTVAIGGLAGLLAGSPTTGVVVAAILSLGYIALGRRWVRAHRPAAAALFADDFDGPESTFAENWSNTAPGDDVPGGTVTLSLQAAEPPAAVRANGALQIVEGGPAGDKWISTKRAFDWTPNQPGEFAHVGAMTDPRIMSDVLRRLRGEKPWTKEPAAALPE